jgi:hypothetical protein
MSLGHTTQRNANQKGIGWHFTTAEARAKLKRLYPTAHRFFVHQDTKRVLLFYRAP